MFTQLTCYFFHEDVIKWKHFPPYRPFVRGIHQWRGVLTLSLICAWKNGWANNRDGYLRRHRAHCDVTVMQRQINHILASFASNGVVKMAKKNSQTFTFGRITVNEMRCTDKVMIIHGSNLTNLTANLIRYQINFLCYLSQIRSDRTVLYWC